ncbi:MAG: FG-GAP-like repeat-containing protein [Microcoleaceae cyanobacterium]
MSLLLSICSLSIAGCVAITPSTATDTVNESLQPKTLQLDLPPQQDEKGVGGLITADVNDDGRKDFIVTKPGYIAVTDHSGKSLWTKQTQIQVTQKAENKGLPGLHGPGVQAADVDGDGKTEVLFLTQDGTLEILAGINGQSQASINLSSPEGTQGWEHLVIANFRGLGDRDILLQATNAEGYRMGRYLAAYSIAELLNSQTPQPLWTQNEFVANAHNGARIADLNGDGKEEVLGGNLISSEGEILHQLPLKGHVDSLFIADVRPDLPGLEVVILEEGGGNDILPQTNRFLRLGNRALNLFSRQKNRIFLYNYNGLIWETDYKRKEPQNAAIGDFEPQRPGLEIWCRSRNRKHQKPFIFDANGELINTYKLGEVAPADWTDKGVEVIFTIDWTGENEQFIAAKERHTAGDVAIFDGLNGEFLYRFPTEADRLYVADVSGDWREEVIVLSGNQLHIYNNPKSNPNQDKPRLWTKDHYRRSKMTWNYYSP